MALTNAELTDEVRDLKKRVKDLEDQTADLKQTVNVNLWQMALQSLEQA